MVQKRGSNKKPQRQSGNAPVTTDPRFAHVHRDPRFMRPKRKDNKVAIDKRFASMLDQDEFTSARKSGTSNWIGNDKNTYNISISQG
jgi:hypothetical protein